MDHTVYMHRAYELALKGWGKVSPNPMVGCVIVKNDVIIAEGYHHRYGDVHAEVDALRKLSKEQIKGATLYVTLEPCSHVGKQPPCTDALKDSGIKHVVVGCLDPNPVNNGRSIQLLRSYGIKVTVGVMDNELLHLNEAFNKYITTKQPWVIGKIAQTIDGKIATITGESKWITSDKSRTLAHRLRYGVDAIMVGINTVLADDPQLKTVPAKNVVKVILDTRLQVSPKAKLFTGTKPGQVYIFTTMNVTTSKAKLLAKKATIVQAPLRAKRLDLKWIMTYLGQQRIGSVLIEGGATVVGNALSLKLVDQMMIYVAPKLMGEGLSSIKGLSIKRLADIQGLYNITAQKIDDDILYTGYLKS